MQILGERPTGGRPAVILVEKETRIASSTLTAR